MNGEIKKSKALRSTSNRDIVFCDDSLDLFIILERCHVRSQNKDRLVFFNEVDDFWSYLEKVKETKTRPPRFISLDINMPKISGLDLLQQIKNIPEFSEIPVVILTCSDREEDKERAYKIGAQTFITKPFKLYEYVELFNSIDKCPEL